MTGEGTAARPLRATDPPRLGRYTLVGRLGEGGMGSVFLARHPDGQLVALKVIRADLAGDATFRRRFRSEVARAQQVPPFCTAEVLDADPDHDPPYLVVEYVDGPSLSEVVRSRGPLTPANLHGLAIGVAAALTAIHGAGIIHRDLKPGNVLLAPGSPKVIDFGIAQPVHGTETFTTTSQVVGTVAYMAPERFDGNPSKTITPAADIFAWGAIVAYAGTGRVPFRADVPAVMAMRIMTQPPELDGLDPQLRELVELALSKDPAARPDARTLLDRLVAGGPRRGVDLGAAQPQLLTTPQPVDALSSMTTRIQALRPARGPESGASTARAPRRGRRGLAAIGVLLVLAAAVGAGIGYGVIPRPWKTRAQGPSADPTSQPLTQFVVGTWVGQLTQTVGNPLAVELHIDEGGRSGTLLYRQERCLGDLSNVEVGVDSIRYKEHIRTGACTPDGVITLTRRTDQNLDLYYVPDGASYTASAVLSRAGAVTTSPSPTNTLVPQGFGTSPVISDRLVNEELWHPEQHAATNTTCAFANGLVVTKKTPGTFRCRGPAESWTDFAFFVDVSLDSAGSCAATWLRYTDAPGGYLLRICQDRFELRSHAGSATKPLVTHPMPVPVALGTRSRIAVVAKGGSLSFHQNGTLAGRYTDSTFAAGRIALGVFQESADAPPFAVTFANVEIWAPAR